ncbi:MAG: hypothetical protein ACLP2Y_05945 [Limisphaerales bacterium]
MNNSNNSLIPLFALWAFLILLWLYVTEQISGVLFGILTVVVFVFVFAKDTTATVLASLAVCLGLGCLVWRVEKLEMAVQTTANLNFKTAETIGYASQQLLASSNAEARNLKLQILIKIISFGIALITFGPVLFKVIRHLVGY